eukprot:856691-Pelagomonas_calceolata.AAC.2
MHTHNCAKLAWLRIRHERTINCEATAFPDVYLHSRNTPRKQEIVLESEAAIKALMNCKKDRGGWKEKYRDSLAVRLRRLSEALLKVSGFFIFHCTAARLKTLHKPGDEEILMEGTRTFGLGPPDLPPTPPNPLPLPLI